MKIINLPTRYNTEITITKEDYNDYYLFDSSNCEYVSEHYSSNGKTIHGIDPEGLYIIAVGNNVPNTNDKIKRIIPFGKKYRLYV